jgi:histidyl-tRNA synthetase
MYKFKDNGDRNVAMRYDQTVPLARVIANYQNELPTPFKRYQIQNVWRAENTQKGRYREFLQVDADIVGSYSPLSDAEIIVIAAKCLETLGFKDYKIYINDRALLSEFPKETIIAIDKLKKVGREGVLKELVEKGEEKDWKKVDNTLTLVENQKPNEKIEEILKVLASLGIGNKNVEFSSTLARGLDYYTGIIFEIEVNGYDAGAIAGGGRYDNLIGMFAKRDIPAVGFAFGFDRLTEAMEALDLFPKNLRPSDLLVAFSSSDLQEKSLGIASDLRSKNISAEIYLDDADLEKQLKYANKKGVPYVLIVSDKFMLKNMKSGEQKEISLKNLPNEIKN